MEIKRSEKAVVLVPETAEEREVLDALRGQLAGRVLLAGGGGGLVLTDLGVYEEAVGEPINITSQQPNEEWRLIGNLAATPFVLDGVEYGSVEGLWQSLRIEDEDERARVRLLAGGQAKRVGSKHPYRDFVRYGTERLRVGTSEHWEVMRRGVRAKFEQHDLARSALLSTGERPLVHRVRVDSTTIPGVIMAEIWMKERARLRQRIEPPDTERGGLTR